MSTILTETNYISKGKISLHMIKVDAHVYSHNRKLFTSFPVDNVLQMVPKQEKSSFVFHITSTITPARSISAA